MRITHGPYKLTVFGNKVPRFCAPRKEEAVYWENRENYVMHSLIICTLQKIFR
jgi:hypothetical protein